ncbi:MAG: dehalogenase [Chloroflexi bacterium]|nr:dehalogenase [Chloroflexota bacterium]
MLWLIIGLIVGVGGWWLVSWAGKKKLGVKWYEWLLTALAVGFALLAIQNFQASLAELEPGAAGILLALFGIPAVILEAIAAFLVWRRQKGVKTPAPAKAPAPTQA